MLTHFQTFHTEKETMLRRKDKVRGPSMKKRTRTSFTEDQLKVLREAFAIHAYVTKYASEALSEKLQIGVQPIKFWFQNQRQRLKKKTCGAVPSTSVAAECRVTPYPAIRPRTRMDDQSRIPYPAAPSSYAPVSVNPPQMHYSDATFDQPVFNQISSAQKVSRSDPWPVIQMIPPHHQSNGYQVPSNSDLYQPPSMPRRDSMHHTYKPQCCQMQYATIQHQAYQSQNFTTQYQTYQSQNFPTQHQAYQSQNFPTQYQTYQSQNFPTQHQEYQSQNFHTKPTFSNSDTSSNLAEYSTDFFKQENQDADYRYPQSQIDSPQFSDHDSASNDDIFTQNQSYNYPNRASSPDYFNNFGNDANILPPGYFSNYASEYLVPSNDYSYYAHAIKWL